MEIKFALLLFGSLSFFGCATLTESPDCKPARQLFSKNRLDIDKFRVKPLENDQFIESKFRQYKGADLTFVNWGNHYLNYQKLISAADWACGSLDGSKQPINDFTDASEVIDEYVSQEKRMADASRLLRSQPNPNIGEPLQILTSREGHKYTVTDPRGAKILNEKIKQASAIDITKKWTREDLFTYPSQSGTLKADAKGARKQLLHQWVRSEYEDLIYIAFFNPQFQKLLSEKTPMRLSQQEADRLCQELADQLSTKFDLKQGDTGEPPTSYWRVFLIGGGSRVQQCESAVGPFSDGETADSDSEYTRELLQDKYLRFKLAEHLLATALTVDATRVSDTQMKLTVSINWPEFWRKYRFAKISELIEK